MGNAETILGVAEHDGVGVGDQCRLTQEGSHG
jgi:hypothetical protein